MRIAISKNAFSTAVSIVFLGFILCLELLVYSLHNRWWVDVLLVTAIWLAVDSLTRKVKLLSFLSGGIDLDEVRLGSVSFTLLPPPEYTTKRTVIVCCIFVVWFSSIVTPIVLWNRGVVILSALLLAAISGVLIVNVIEKRWGDHGQVTLNRARSKS